MGEAKNTEAVEAFIRRWQGREGGQERANYVSFLNELIALLGLPPPDPADYQLARFAKGVDKQAAKEEGAQVAAELIAAVEQKPSFPTSAVEQTAAVFAALAAATAPLDAKGLAAQFKRTKTTEKKVGEVLASLARLGYVTSEDGKAFALRRVA